MLQNVKYLVCDLDQQSLFIHPWASPLTVTFVVSHLFCLEILCGDILLSNNNPQPFNAQSLRPLASSQENTENTDSSTEK